MYQGISFGAIVANAETFEPIETLERSVKFDSNKYKWSAEAEAIHGLSIEWLEKNGVTKEEAAADLASLILKYWGPTGLVMFAGHNTGFDVHATDQLLGEFGIMPVAHHVLLDTSGLGFVLINEFKSNQVFELLGGIDKRGMHNALDDASATLAALRNAKQIFAAGLAGT